MYSETMPWGQHKGRPIGQLPIGYCVWLVESCNLRPQLRDAVEWRIRQWTRRHCGLSEPQFSTVELRLPFDASKLRRKFAAKYHPDRPGGSRDAMRAVNDVMDELDRLCEGLKA
ncbi:putative quorum-sensing-regulated virulence factor [Crateriforma conspicua]|uniref:DnaJ domain protein n=1 Tax=Crateriforma conspicua TaxID=2527996 RepID=A0A5C5Y5L9_9PLAN|nr:hypothetical protein Pan14r_23100 [Crateriforma conspicua]